MLEIFFMPSTEISTPRAYLKVHDAENFSDYDAENLRMMVHRLVPGYPREHFHMRVYRKREGLQLANFYLTAFTPDRENVQPHDYALLQHISRRYGAFNTDPTLDMSPILTNVEQAYSQRFTYTPTPEITNTPDHHWAKISLDILYKNQILVGDPK